MPARADQNQLRRIQILFEDDFVLCVAKPAGIAVHGGAEKKRTVIEILAAAYPEPQRLHLVHRLDKDTSGVLLVAKNADVARTISELWTRYRKRYLALVLGRMDGERTIDAPLPDDDGRLVLARTVVTSLGSGDGATFVVAEILTGRTHQIRRHLQAAGHPILMDDKHGDFGANKAFAGQMQKAGFSRPKHTLLHAYHLRGPHPCSGEILDFTASVPEAFLEAIGVAGARVDALRHLS